MFIYFSSHFGPILCSYCWSFLEPMNKFCVPQHCLWFIFIPMILNILCSEWLNSTTYMREIYSLNFSSLAPSTVNFGSFQNSIPLRCFHIPLNLCICYKISYLAFYHSMYVLYVFKIPGVLFAIRTLKFLNRF